MKKTVFLLVAIVGMILGFTLTDCQSAAQKRLKAEIANTNKKCPASLGFMGEMTSVNYDEKANEVVMTYTLDGEYAPVSHLKQNSELVRQSIGLMASDKDVRMIFDSVKSAGASLKFVFRNLNSPEFADFSLTQDEIKELLDNPGNAEDNKELLMQNNLLLANAQCPATVDEGMVMTAVLEENGYVVYKYDIDENIYDIDTMISLKENIKSEMNTLINDPGIRALSSLIEKTGRKGLVYRYIGDQSGKSFDIIFTTAELTSAY